MMKIFLIALLCCFCNLLQAEDPLDPWVVYYGDSAPIESFAPYKLIVFDSDHHPILAPFLENNVTTLGYLNLGEVEDTRDYFAALKNKGLLLEENKNWKGSYFIDIRNKYWSKMVVEELIPQILFQHFTGVFLDTLDNAQYLETSNPQKYKGMMKAAANLVKAIRLNYPTIPIMMNRGYYMLPEVADEITMELAESFYTSYNFDKKTYEIRPKEEYEQQVKLLQDMQKKHPKLKIFTLDYWNETDPAMIAKIYAIQRGNGFIPYVATIDLNKIVPEPK